MRCPSQMPRLPAYSTFTVPANPSSCRLCRSSTAKLFAASADTVTENSSSIFKSEPERSLGRIFVPRRFHTSGGTLPTSRSTCVAAMGVGLGYGGGSGSIAGVVGVPGSGFRVVDGDTGLPALSISAVTFLSCARRCRRVSRLRPGRNPPGGRTRQSWTSAWRLGRRVGARQITTPPNYALEGGFVGTTTRGAAL